MTEVWQRPLRSDAERNRRLVLEAAAQAFAEEGFDVGMAEIARRAGVGNATVFRRFPTKDALYEAIVDEKIAELCAAATARGGAARSVGRARALPRDDRRAAGARPRLLPGHRAAPARAPRAPAPPPGRSSTSSIRSSCARRRPASLRDDVTTLDVLGLVKGAVACVPPSPGLRADGWRRPLAIVLDALRPEAATPLPIPPLSYEEIERALGIESKVERT